MATVRADVAVVGGGMVGATLAALLAGAGRSVAVVEPLRPGLPPPGRRDLRVSALSRHSQALLQRIGAWPALAATATPYRAMEVWDGTGDGRTRFGAEEIGETDLGHIVENRRIQHAAWQQLERLDGVTLCCPARAEDLLATPAGIQLGLDTGQLLEARLVVAADGGDSRVRAWSGVQTVGWEYGQKTVVCNLRTELPNRASCWQRFTPSGPVAFLPLDKCECSLAWHTNEHHADHLLSLDDAQFADDLEVASAGVLGRAEPTGPRGAFKLRFQHALQYHARRVVLVGDAAHTIHPLAGQGVNLGLLDAACLAEILGDPGDRDPGERAGLTRYQRRRLPENLAMLLAMDAFKRGFGNSNELLRRLRNLGLAAAGGAGLLKRRVMRQAMGM